MVVSERERDHDFTRERSRVRSLVRPPLGIYDLIPWRCATCALGRASIMSAAPSRTRAIPSNCGAQGGFEQGEVGPDLFRHACMMGLEGLERRSFGPTGSNFTLRRSLRKCPSIRASCPQ
jgi:hypothetical protein